VSSASRYPKKPAHTVSREKTSAIRVALIRRCAHTWIRYASALAKTPVTTSAAQTVQPRGIVTSPSATAMARKPTNAVVISMKVRATGS